MHYDAGGLDLLSAVGGAAQEVARTLRSDGVAAVLIWGDPSEAEVVFHEGLPVVLRKALGAGGGRVLAAALRREDRPLLVEPAALVGEEPGMAAALEVSAIAALAAFPLYAEAGIVGCMVVPVDAGIDLEQSRQEWRIACRSVAVLQLAAAVASIRALLAEDRRQPAGWADGVLVYDQWERVLFADGFFREFPGWNRQDPFARALNVLPGGAVLTGMKPSHPGRLVWEEHLLLPVSGHGIPVALASRPLDVGGAHARLVLVRDLRADDQRGPDPSTRILALSMRVAHASDELLQAVGGSADERSDRPKSRAACRGLELALDAPAVVQEALDRVSGGRAPDMVDLTMVVEDILVRFGSVFESERVRVFRFLAPEMSSVPGDALTVARGIRSMVRAARASLRPSGGTLTVRTWAQDGYAWVAVSDDGSSCIADASGFRQLFPAEGQDAADGLEALAKVALDMGGRLLSETHERLWNRLTMTLPLERRVTSRNASAVEPAAENGSCGSEGLRVLVVDDNAALRSVLRRYLERRGHQVTEAVDGDDALGIVDGGDFDRLIVDVNMPGKTGPELYECMREVAPSMCGRTIFMTGGFLEEVTEQFIKESGRPSIKKPFDLTEMLRTVETA